jgi:phospholipid/cholesterol/gamma-HCH transport system substrate-binding protein
VTARNLVLGTLCLVVLAVGGILVLGGSDSGYVVKAAFDDAGGVRKNSDVKIGEVPAGTITDVSLGKGDKAIVTMKLDKGVGPIGAGATARSRPVNLLGEKFVDLAPGDLSRPVASGTTIPATRTGTAVELDDILNTLQPGTRARLRILINEAGIALAGRGRDFNQLLEQLPGGLDESARFLAALSSDTAKLESLVEKGDRVIGAVSGKREDLGRFVQSASDALAVTASRRAALGRTLAAAPGGLSELRRTLGQLQQAGDDLRPAAAQLRATAGPLASTLRRLPSFAADARQTLTAATRVAPQLDRLGVQGAPTVRRLRPTVQRLSDFAGELQPVSDELANGALKNLLRFMNNWGALTSLEDGIGHIFRVRLLAGPEVLTGDKPQRAARSRLRPKAAPTPRPQPAPQAPKAPEAPAAPARPTLPQLSLPDLLKLPGLPKVTGGAPKSVTEVLPQVTDALLGKDRGTRDGQDDSQDTLRLLDYLFGN